MPTSASSLNPLLAQRGRRGGAFTLIELLVVLAIIGILTTIAVVLAGRVTGSGKERLTTDVIRVLDTALTEYLSEREKVPAIWRDQRTTGGPQTFAMFDGRLQSDAPIDPAYASLEVFLLAASEVSGTATTLKGLSPTLVEDFTGDFDGQRPKDANNNDIRVLSVKDAWSKGIDTSLVTPNDINKIRFVHPAFHGGYGDYWNGAGNVARNTVQYNLNGTGGDEELRRSYRTFNPTGDPSGSVGDADEGVCPGNRPYFYSVGPDGDPGTREDNVYSTRPTFPGETAKLN